MSYSIKLVDTDGNPVEVPRHLEGANQLIGGNTAAETDVTYNYSWFFHKHIDADEGIRWLYGKTGAEVVDTLNAAIIALGTEQSLNYWESTPGNAGHALEVLRRWAVANPNAVFRGD